MTKPAHTKAPWRVQRSSTRNYLEVVAYHPFAASLPHATGDICLAMPTPYFDRAEQEANAHLIGAAPDMLAALKLALPICEDAYNDADALAREPSEYAAERRQSANTALAAWEAVKAVIAKAEGRADA